jgi:hypothetical protein
LWKNCRDQRYPGGAIGWDKRRKHLRNIKEYALPSILTIGIVFLVIGFVQQGFTFSFDSGLFSLGVIFTLSGLVALALGKNLSFTISSV